MSTKPHRIPSPPVVVLAMAVTVLSGGCSVEPIQTPTFSSSTTSTTPPPAPLKYSATGWTSCSEVRQKLIGDLPPPLPDDKQEGPKWSTRKCAFRNDDSLVVLSIQYWETVEDVTGVYTGAERAKEQFRASVRRGDKDNSVIVGSDVRWRESDDTDTGCTLEILDENAVVLAHNGSLKSLIDGTSEQCRGRARELAKQFYAAVQPQ